MDIRGGCCIARYGNGSFYDMSKVDRIMLKYRPIAPKPAAEISAAGSGRSTAISNERVSTRKGRGRRKYNKENKSNNKKINSNSTRTSTSNKKIKSSISKETALTRKTSCDSVVTLSLLPETPDRKESVEKENSKSPLRLSFGSKEKFEPSDREHVEQTAVMTSTVTVECVTDTWLDGNMLGFSDEERLTNLMKDMFPGFISDGWNQVGWTNKAYGEMVGGEEVIVSLVMKENVPFTCDAFSCRVRVQSTCRKEKGTITFPCDVWRMDGGGFAWRLDVEAALSLGR